MKKIYILLTILLTLATWSCRSKKSTTDFKETKTENVSVADNSVVKKKLTTDEKTGISKTETTADKSFFEAWMSFESDKITITDNAGNKTEITNPRINKKSSQKAEVLKTVQSDSESNKVDTKEENQQSNINATLSKETKTDLQQSNSSKGKEPVWLYVIGAVLVGGFGYFILKRFKLI